MNRMIGANVRFISFNTARQLIKESVTGLSTYEVHVMGINSKGRVVIKTVTQTSHVAKFVYRTPDDSDLMNISTPKILQSEWTIDFRDNK